MKIKFLILTVLIYNLAWATPCQRVNQFDGWSNPTPTPTPTATPTPGPTPTPTATPPATGMIVWGNGGQDKVAQGELRLANSTDVTNPWFDGTKITLRAAKNEVVAFSVYIESPNVATNNVSVEFVELNGPNGFKIETTGSDIFNYTNRNIELFYVRYLQIKGLSRLSYDIYDERHVPKRFQRPYTGEGFGTGTWSDRPDHDKYYPDIAVPLELHPTFNIGANQTQQVWADIYVPKAAPSGLYTGTVLVKENGATRKALPVELSVRSFTLPDEPTSKTMASLGHGDVNNRYFGDRDPGASVQPQIEAIRDTHFKVAHRHKISLIDSNWGQTPHSSDSPRSEWTSRLDGSLFTAANGYDGPGVSTGNNVFSIGTYSSWTWKNEGESGMRTHTDAWATWFQQNAPDTEFFLYLIDESQNYTLIEQWASWMKNNPGIGSTMLSFATMDWEDAQTNVPSLDVAGGWIATGITSEWEGASTYFCSDTGKRMYMYNGKRPASGSFAIEDDGVALIEIPWGQWKKGIDRWFFWETTYYNNFQAGAGETNVFQQAKTFGATNATDPSIGETGWNYSNGDGVLFYPGTDKEYPAESYDIDGPIVSTRLKLWRRGIQDVDYIALAYAINPSATEAIVNQAVPSVMWEPGVTDPQDPTWWRGDISWSIDPADWEAKRQALAAIIEGN